jgi:predicted small metal-binding protein
MVKGETVEEVTQKALEHVKENHSSDFNALQSPEQIHQMEIALSRSTRIIAD